jgi:hypothetical protein
MEFIYALPAALQNQTLSVEILPLGVSDANPADNKKSFGLFCADAAIAETRTADADGARTIAVDVENKGYEPLNAVLVELYGEDETPGPLTTQTLGALAAGNAQTLTFDVAAYSDTHFRVAVSQAKSELRYANNQETVSFHNPMAGRLYIPLSKYTLGAGLNVETAYVNDTGEAQAFTSIIAVYDGARRLVSVKREPVALLAHDSLDVTADFEKITSGYVHSFAWRDADGAKPLCEKSVMRIQ